MYNLVCDNVDGLSSENDLLFKLITYIQQDCVQEKKHSLIVMSKTPFWEEIKNIYETDKPFTNTISEMVNTLNLGYAIDDFCTKLFMESFPNHIADMQHIAGILSKMLIKNGFQAHVSEMFKRHLTWTALTGFTPYDMCDMQSQNKKLYNIHLVSKTRVELLREIEEAVFSHELTTYMFNPAHFTHLLNLIPNIPATLIRTIGIAYSRTIIKMDMGDAKLLGVMLCGIIRRHYNSYLPFIPPVDLNVTQMIYCFDNDECYVIDKKENCYKAIGEPISFNAELSSPAYKLKDYSQKFQSLFQDYMKAASMNAKRTVVTAPQTQQEPSLSSVTREINKGELSRTTYENLIQFTGMMNHHQHTTVAESNVPPGLVGMGSGNINDPNNTALSFLLRNNNNNIQERMYNEFNSQLDDLKDKSSKYSAFKTILGHIEGGNVFAATQHMETLTEDDQRLLKGILTNAMSKPRTETPDIHRLPENTKLLCLFTTNISLPEIEELLHLWTVVWESMFTGINMFTRRKHALQYSSTGKQVSIPSISLQITFLKMINTAGVFVEHLYPTKIPRLTFAELMVLTDKIDISSIPELFANQIGLNPSEIRLREDLNNPEIILETQTQNTT